jgi:ABC-2 type transport system ATP-binding protein
MADLTGRENTLTDELSGGGRQRLSLGAAILHQPELIFLDEPTAGVDPISRRAFWDLLYTLASRGVTVFVTTHYMDEAEHCHKLALIREGQIFAQGSNAQIKQDLIPGPVLEITTPDAGKVIRLIREDKREGRLPDVQVALYGSRIHVLGGVAEPLQTMVADVLRRVQIENFEISMIEPSLEDVFIACIG